MTTIKIRSLLPVQTDQDDMKAHCAAFGLTLREWSKSTHRLEVTVEETVSPEKQRQIAAAMTAQFSANLIAIIE